MTTTTAIKGINVQELTKKILNGDQIFILDVRNTGDFDDWKIEGENVHIINKPYFDLIDSLDPIMDQLPKGLPIYVICAKGGSSEFVAEQIAEAGYDHVYSIEGGMKAWSEYLEPIKIGDLTGGGTIYQFVRIGKGCLSYLVESNGEAAIIDAARMIEPYEQFISEHNLKLTHLLDTHLHADHISGGRTLAEKVGAEYHLPPKDAEEVTYSYTKLEDGNEIKVGKVLIKAIYSPGHTIGSTSFIVDDQYLLTGDILFIDSIGRPDLAGKAEDWVADLRQTLYDRYKQLADNLIVLPAHYMGINEMNKDGSVSEELGKLYKENHGLNINDENEFRKTVSENLPPQPNAYQEIREMNMGKIHPDLEEQREMEIGPNRCAVR
ncbi:MBL fold metallo-hydrolase [Halalkalibacter krulwichiae]|uniref:Putative polyketide biosynthesis zinc-dependent hydrolase BaeB n=1 Tax=Halalkalibacter krulwichiae TaxID=199441 RepID=A0A1X9MDP7_9BACI|nr:MBL fold metallo-hydrolase [Halalkalibacter krulwichiae]ARK30670.1 putative polyketide biosynthesis zinc-dependent hydrolase BaeB [Halalkalibacter krulwichiae]